MISRQCSENSVNKIPFLTALKSSL